MEALGYVVGSSWDAFSGTLVLTGTWVSLWGGDPGNWFSVLCSSQIPTQRGNTLLSICVAFHRSLSFKQFPFSVPPSFTPICFLGRVSLSHSLVCTVPRTKGLCSLVVPLGTAVRQIKGYKVCIKLFCNLSCTTSRLCQSV